MAQFMKALARHPPGAARRWLDASISLIHGLFPPSCYLCLDPGQAPALDLCRGCEDDLPRNRCACPACAEPDCGGLPCAGCRRLAKCFDAAFVPYGYEFPLPELIHRFKYRGQLAIGRILGTLLARRLAERGRPRVDAIVPVPLYPVREARRGYNQAREIAGFVGAALGLPLRDGLVRRIRDTEEQAALPGIVRATNVSGAFGLRGLPPLRVAIVDDVLTTGATANAVARVLRDGGCRHIEVWAVARASGADAGDQPLPW